MECQDTRGLMHAITGALLEHGMNITQNQEFVDGKITAFSCVPRLKVQILAMHFWRN